MINTTVIGRLVADPEMKESKSGYKYVKILVSANTDDKAENGYYVSNLFICSAFGKVAEIIAERFTKGMYIAVNGKSKINTYQGKDGEWHAAIMLSVTAFDFVNTSKGDLGNAGSPVNPTAGDIDY